MTLPSQRLAVLAAAKCAMLLSVRKTPSKGRRTAPGEAMFGVLHCSHRTPKSSFIQARIEIYNRA